MTVKPYVVPGEVHGTSAERSSRSVGCRWWCHDEALLKSRWLDELAKKFKDKERLAERLCNAKFKRAEAKQKRKPKNPYGRCTRMYEALIEEQQAKLESRWYAEKAARGEAEANIACRVAVLQLENARLKRQLRRYS